MLQKVSFFPKPGKLSTFFKVNNSIFVFKFFLHCPFHVHQKPFAYHQLTLSQPCVENSDATGLLSSSTADKNEQTRPWWIKIYLAILINLKLSKNKIKIKQNMASKNIILQKIKFRDCSIFKANYGFYFKIFYCFIFQLLPITKWVTPCCHHLRQNLKFPCQFCSPLQYQM